MYAARVGAATYVRIMALSVREEVAELMYALLRCLRALVLFTQATNSDST